jgi:Tfp pilus assembly protein PilO
MEKYILQLGELTWSKVVVGGLIAAGAYWGLQYDDGSSLEEGIKTLQETLVLTERQLRETKEAMADAEKFEKAVRQNEIQFDKVLEYLPQEINANELTRLVNQQAQVSGPRVQTTKALDLIEKKEFYEMTRLEFSLVAFENSAAPNL